MRGFKAELERDIKLEEQLLERYEKELAASPRGSLTRYCKGRKTYYKHVFYVTEGHEKKVMKVERHLRREDEALFYALQRKVFLRKAIKVLRNNIKQQKALEKYYEAYDYSHLLATFGDAYQMEEWDRFFREEGICDAESRQKEFRTEGLTQWTAAGFKVRSKSEALIVNALYERRIRFVYEQELRIKLPGGGIVTLHPDLVLLLADGNVKVWEHLGMLIKKDYAVQFGERLNLYSMAGYTLGENLILTADDAAGHLDLQVVARIIDWLEPLCMKR